MAHNARMAKLADALDLGSSAFGRGGSTPPSRTNFLLHNACISFVEETMEPRLFLFAPAFGHKCELRYVMTGARRED